MSDVLDGYGRGFHCGIKATTDYQSKYNDLRSAIATYLTALEPWYLEGSVVDPMVAVNALKAIHREVHR